MGKKMRVRFNLPCECCTYDSQNARFIYLQYSLVLGLKVTGSAGASSSSHKLKAGYNLVHHRATYTHMETNNDSQSHLHLRTI